MSADWIEDLSIGRCNNGWFVRLDGSNVFDGLNIYGSKGRKSLSISEGNETESEARAKAAESKYEQRRDDGMMATVESIHSLAGGANA